MFFARKGADERVASTSTYKTSVLKPKGKKSVANWSAVFPSAVVENGAIRFCKFSEPVANIIPPFAFKDGSI
jgi:hypothetical protein